MRSRLLKSCFGLSVIMPLAALVTFGLAPKQASAAPDDGGCDCTSYCEKGIAYCTMIICGTGPNQQYEVTCYGTYIQK